MPAGERIGKLATRVPRWEATMAHEIDRFGRAFDAFAKHSGALKRTADLSERKLLRSRIEQAKSEMQAAAELLTAIRELAED